MTYAYDIIVLCCVRCGFRLLLHPITIETLGRVTINNRARFQAVSSELNVDLVADCVCLQ